MPPTPISYPYGVFILTVLGSPWFLLSWFLTDLIRLGVEEGLCTGLTRSTILLSRPLLIFTLASPQLMCWQAWRPYFSQDPRSEADPLAIAILFLFLCPFRFLFSIAQRVSRSFAGPLFWFPRQVERLQ